MKTNRLALLCAVIVALCGGVVHSAEASNIHCGGVLTSNTTLSFDIGPCSSDGFIIDADNITLNLNGHKVYGTSSTGDGDGVRIDGHHGVTVKNGTISEFDEGVYILNGAANNVLSNIKAIGNVGDGVQWGDGVFIYQSPGNVLTHSVLRGNGPFSGVSAVGVDAVHNKILSNVIVGNTTGIDLAGAGDVAKYNRVEDSPRNGIAVIGSGEVVRSNTVSGNGVSPSTPGDGIDLIGATNARVISNKIRDNGRDGLNVDAASSGNVLQDNSALGDGAIGTSLGEDLVDATSGCTTNTWHGNTGKTYNQTCVLAP